MTVEAVSHSVISEVSDVSGNQTTVGDLRSGFGKVPEGTAQTPKEIGLLRRLQRFERMGFGQRSRRFTPVTGMFESYRPKGK